MLYNEFKGSSGLINRDAGPAGIPFIFKNQEDLKYSRTAYMSLCEEKTQ
jgi:hypothetical protein